MKTKEKIVVMPMEEQITREEQIKLTTELRNRTNMGMLYCKYALKNSNWNLDKAQLYLKENIWKLL